MAALAEAVRALPQPVIAAVNGPCVGAGFALDSGLRHSDLFDGSVIRQRRHPARAIGRRDGHELPPAAHRGHQRRRRLDAQRPHGVGRRSRSARPGQRAGRAGCLDRARRGVGLADRRSFSAGCAVDQARAAGQHRRGRPVLGAGIGESQPGDLARHRRSGRATQKWSSGQAHERSVTRRPHRDDGRAGACSFLRNAVGRLGRRRHPRRSPRGRRRTTADRLHGPPQSTLCSPPTSRIPAVATSFTG